MTGPSDHQAPWVAIPDERWWPRSSRTVHFGIHVDDLERSIGLWRDALGFELTSGPFEAPGEMVARVHGVAEAQARVAMLEGGGIEIELAENSIRGESATRNAPADPGVPHIALEVGDLDATLAAAEGHGATLVGEAVEFDIPRGTGRLLYMRDPDGCVIELIEID
ncbi:hypothetical protein HJD18_09885 [Thermoleophilia bacterium SCSIO 60948]|nr:hypothetical protein HJD18_09885 [Thermoleophilia bacterium SCSIO 60948]